MSGIITVPRFRKMSSAPAVTGPLAASIIKGALILSALRRLILPSIAAD